MRPLPPGPGGPRRRPLRAALRLLPLGALLSCQLVLAGPAQARAGDLDPGFGAGGLVTTDFGGSFGDSARALVAQADGKLVAAGVTFGSSVQDFALARYNPDGTLDSTFGTGGRVVTDIDGVTPSDDLYALAVQSDGKLVAAGSTFTDGAANLDFALVRYNPDGTLDPTFGTGGKVITDIAASGDTVHALVGRPDDKLAAAGLSSSLATSGDFAVVRYNPDGTLDPTFGAGGKVTTDFNTGDDAARALALQSDGKLVAAGSATTDSGLDFAVVRYNANGSPDLRFGTAGKATTEVAGTFDVATAVVVQPNGKIVLGGQGINSDGSDFDLVRYRQNGTLDPTFGTGGKVMTDFAAGSDGIRALALQPNGRLVAAGVAQTESGSNFAVARYRHDGSLDPTFGSGGKVTTDFPDSSSEIAWALAIQPDGNLAAAGDVNIGQPSGGDFGVARYRAR
jgi:uncharacterized delta-60 repeat protein